MCSVSCSPRPILDQLPYQTCITYNCGAVVLERCVAQNHQLAEVTRPWLGPKNSNSNLLTLD